MQHNASTVILAIKSATTWTRQIWSLGNSSVLLHEVTNVFFIENDYRYSLEITLEDVHEDGGPSQILACDAYFSLNGFPRFQELTEYETADRLGAGS